MSKRLSVVVFSVVFVLGLVLVAIWHKFGLCLFPKLSRFVHEQAIGFRVIHGECDYYIPDNTAGHIHKPYATRTPQWKEHPNGSIKMSVNNVGFREDVDTATKKHIQTYRILVTGDSHIDGVVNNSESFANRLEMLLNSLHQRLSFEVLNGGTGYYGPYNYAGFLRKFLYLKPDMFVVVLYTGNDFSDGIRTAEIRHHVRIPEQPVGYTRQLHDAASQNSAAVWQALNQAYFFKTYPEFQNTAVDIAYQQLLDITRTCSSNDIELLVLTLPTKLDLPVSSREPTWESARVKLGLKLEDVGISKRMGRLLLARLNSASVRTLDPFSAMRQSRNPLYWEADYHLNHVGHSLLAEIVFDHLKSFFLSMDKPNEPEAPNNRIESDEE
jgi:hypothetical protein